MADDDQAADRLARFIRDWAGGQLWALNATAMLALAQSKPEDLRVLAKAVLDGESEWRTG
jgi:hypothetical protein